MRLKPVLVRMPEMEQCESDCFLRRVAACASSSEVREVVKQVKKLYEPEPTPESEEKA